MAKLLTTLNVWATTEPERKAKLLADLAELLNRHRYQGEANGNFAFHDPRIALLPTRMSKVDIRSIVQYAGPILIDAGAPERLRATAAFVLGKTYTVEALNFIMQAVTEPGLLPAEVARQCAFAYDSLIEVDRSQIPARGSSSIGEHFVRQGIPWDAHTGRVDVESL